MSGNWWVDCPAGLSIGNGTKTSKLADGNVVFDNGFSMTGGTLKFNTNNTNAPLPVISCVPPGVTTPCARYTSPGASFVYLRDGDINVTGGVLTEEPSAWASRSASRLSLSSPTWRR